MINDETALPLSFQFDKFFLTDDLKGSIADGEGFVEEVDLAVDVHCGREGEPRTHAMTQVLEWEIPMRRCSGESNDALCHRTDLTRVKTMEEAVGVDVLSGPLVLMETSTQSEETGDRSVAFNGTSISLEETCNEPKECGFPTSVATVESNPLTRFQRERDIIHRYERC